MHQMSVLLQSLFTLTTGFCGTRPIEHPVPNSAWVLITEEFSCGVSSQWTEVSARNLQTGEKAKLASYGAIKEFKILFAGDQAILSGSNPAPITQYRNQIGRTKLRFTFVPSAGAR